MYTRARLAPDLFTFPNFVGQEQCSLPEVFSLFQKNKIETDVTFSVKCGDGCIEFSAHKLILSMWSPVFADMCYIPEKNAKSNFPINDVSPATFEAMLKFMYGSSLDHQNKNIRLLIKLYDAAGLYQIKTLSDVCRDALMCSKPDKHNVFQLFRAGEILNCENLKQRCQLVLQNQTPEVLAAQELCNVTPSMIKLILDLPRISFFSEYDLISWVLAWVKNEVLKHSNEKSFKDIFIEFAPHLNLTKLTAEEFGKLFQNRKDLMSEKEGFSIFMNIANPGSWPLPDWGSSTPRQRVYRNYAEKRC
ncbi:BTB domain-containing protein [Caerostris darwini]|uniref:BTB domain-containing protein n=1 Tax=Caerostris darwini TaxID=1538125 RepID=A0AAV4VVT7_9ARAC|nr:BTB domain-containing protein [Caerostris darwini]